MDADVYALLFLRMIVGITMIAHGLNHWRGGGRIDGTARWFSGLGLRHGRLQAWASVLTEIGAGALLVLGLLTSLACSAVVSVMLVAGLLAHRPNGFFVFKEGYEPGCSTASTDRGLALFLRWKPAGPRGLTRYTRPVRTAGISVQFRVSTTTKAQVRTAGDDTAWSMAGYGAQRDRPHKRNSSSRYFSLEKLLSEILASEVKGR